MLSTKFDGGSLEAVACKPDAKSVKPLLDFLPQFLSVTVLILAAFHAAIVGTMPWGKCLVTVGNLVFLLQASSCERCLNATSGLSRLLGRAVCDDSAEWMCCPLGARSGAQSDYVLPDLCWASISSGSSCVDVSPGARSVVVTSGRLCCSDGARVRVESDGSSGLCMLIALSGESLVDVPSRSGRSTFFPGSVRFLASGMGRVSVFLDSGRVVGAVLAGERD